MVKKKPSWDDIPSLNGLEVDREYEPENPGERVSIKKSVTVQK